MTDAIKTLPPRCFADCPLEDREKMLEALKTDGAGKAQRLDEAAGWFHWYSDNSRRGPRVTSQVYLKLFRRKNGETLVFVHIPKPFADGSVPGTNQTFVLRRTASGGWEDVGREVFPKDLDLTWHLRPRRESPVIEAGPYQKFRRADGRGDAFSPKTVAAELIWDGERFLMKPVPGSRAFHFD